MGARTLRLFRDEILEAIRECGDVFRWKDAGALSERSTGDLLEVRGDLPDGEATDNSGEGWTFRGRRRRGHEESGGRGSRLGFRWRATRRERGVGGAGEQ